MNLYTANLLNISDNYSDYSFPPQIAFFLCNLELTDNITFVMSSHKTKLLHELILKLPIIFADCHIFFIHLWFFGHFIFCNRSITVRFVFALATSCL